MTSNKKMYAPPPDDRILPITRVAAAIVIPFLLLAFVILYLFPVQYGDRFAWTIKPNLMALYMGSGYLGGAWLFLQVALGRRWHRVAFGFPAVTIFTTAMLAATFIHWDRFEISHLGFQLWLILYIITPILVPWLWRRNRRTMAQGIETGDLQVPSLVRLGVLILGGGVLLVSIASFIYPDLLLKFWPWPLTPLMARVLAGWGGLLGVGNLMISNDPRWSAWKTGIQSIALWHFLFLLRSFSFIDEFNSGQWLNWFTCSITVVLGLIVCIYLFFELNRRKMRTISQGDLFKPGR